MNTSDFTSVVMIEQTEEAVFNAILNVRGWWQGEIAGSSQKLNDEFSYRMREFHYSKQKVVEIVPNKRIVWMVTESELNGYEDKSEWTGSKITFEISRVDQMTRLSFTHVGLKPSLACYHACSGAWGMLIHDSLKSLITTGKGKNVFG